MTLVRDPVWYSDIRVLAARWDAFWPTPAMTLAERTNAYTRLILYVTAATYLYKRDTRIVVFGAALAALVSVLHVQQQGRQQARGEPFQSYQAAHAAVRGSVAAVASSGTAPCKRSTPTNPFANYLLTDDPNGPAACAYDDHAADIRDNFNKGTFRNVEDIWEKQGSQRQFYTMPVSRKIPDTHAFAEFLWGGPSKKICKEDPAVCTGTRS